MRVLIPDDIIGENKLVSSTITDDLDLTPEWSALTTYTAGQQVQYRHTAYTAKVVGEGVTNIGRVPGPASDFWEEGDPSNKWAMFDSYVSTQTVGVANTDIVVALTSARADSLCLLNMENVESVHVQMTFISSGEIVMDETISLRGESSQPHLSWWEYFFGVTEYQSQVILEFDPWTGSQITITISPVEGLSASVGHCLIGTSAEIGSAQWGVAPSFTDYSQVSRNDETGRTQLTQGFYAKNLDIPIWVSNTEMDNVMNVLSSARAVPAVWDANENGTNWKTLITLGFIREFTVTIPGPTHSTYNLTVEGLI